VIVLFPIIYLCYYGKQLRKAIAERNNESISTAFEYFISPMESVQS